MTFWTWLSGFASAWVVVFLTRGEWWLAAFYVAVAVFCAKARRLFPAEVVDGTASFRRARRDMRGGR